ncbi:MAG: alpha/beta hydrolase, partial [Pseudomonadota bacterium]
FYVTTSSLPEETAKFRKHIEVKGFDVIAPYRPCFGQSEPAEHKNTPEGYANDCVALINELGVSELHIAGHREGGIFAAKLARRIGPGALSLTIINTGAPVTDWTILHKGSLVARRSLVTAIKAPKALELGYRLAVRIFKSGQAGENKILDVFYSGSPIDAATYQDPVLREVTRNNIAFCFQSSDDIVADIALWASDWSDDLDNLSSATKALFIHSEEHDFMLADWVRNLCRDNPRLDCKVIPLSGQTMLYTNTKKVTDLLAVQIDAGTCGKP